MGYCTDCGQQIPDDAQYCIACGTKVPGAIGSSNGIGHRRRAIPWWVGVVVGVCVVVLVGILVSRAFHPPITHSDNPSSEFQPIEPPSGPLALAPNVVMSLDGVTGPGILPTSPFYFVKDISRDVRYAFAFDPIDKANLRLRFANEDVLAIRAMWVEEEYLEAAQQCFKYQDNFFTSLAWAVKARKQGGDVDALMMDLITAHRVHRLVLADALQATDGSLREAVIGAITYTSAPLEQVIQWSQGVDEAAEFHSQMSDDLSPLGGDVWEQIENRLGLEAEQSVALREAMSDSAAVAPAPVITSVRAEQVCGVDPGSQVAITCQATDLSGGALAYQWLTAHGRIDGQGASVTWTAPAYTGTYQITVVVSDDSGNQSSKAISIRVEAQETPYPGYLGEELFAAAVVGDAQEVERLLHRGADVNARRNTDQTPLHEAAYEGHIQVVGILLDHGADVDALDESNITPLRVAAQRGRTEVVTVLLDSGAYVNAMAGDGFEPLHIAAAYGHVDTARALLDRGADLNAATTSSSGATALHLAAQEGHTEVASLLLDRGADVDARALSNLTPLMAAAKQGHTGVARLLLERGADVNAREDVLDFSPLHFAAFYGHTEMARLLLEHEADVNALAHDVATPLVLARANSCPDIVVLLEEYGGVT